MKKEMEMLQRVLLESRNAERGSSISDSTCLGVVAAIGMAGYLVLVIGHML